MISAVLAALPTGRQGAELAEVLAVVRRAVPAATEAEVLQALGTLGTGRPGARQVECDTRQDDRGVWRTRWWRVTP